MHATAIAVFRESLPYLVLIFLYLINHGHICGISCQTHLCSKREELVISISL